MKRTAAAIVGLLAAASPAAALDVDGNWSIRIADCETPGFDPGTMVLNTEEGYAEYYGASCTIDRWEPVGVEAASWYATFTCRGEETTWTAKAIFALDAPYDPGPLRLIEIDLTSGMVIGYYGCSVLGN